MKYVLALALLLVALFTLQASAQNGTASGMTVTNKSGVTNTLSNWMSNPSYSTLNINASPNVWSGSTPFSAFTVNQTATGSATATESLNNFTLSDTVSDPGNQLYGLGGQYNYGNGSQGGRRGLSFLLCQCNGANTDSGANNFYVGGTISMFARYTQPGSSSTTPLGHVFGINGVGEIQNGFTATNYYQVAGAEFDVQLSSGSSSAIRSGVTIADLAGTAQGFWDDNMLWLYGGGKPWRYGIMLGDSQPWPIDGTVGTIIGARIGSGSYNSRPYAAQWGIDLEQVIFPSDGTQNDGGFLRSNGFNVDGAGTISQGSCNSKWSSTGVALDCNGAVGTSAAIATAGTGYTVGTSTVPVTYSGGVWLVTVNGSGVPTAITQLVAPTNPNGTTPSNPVTPTNVNPQEAGTGLTLNITWNTTAKTVSIGPTNATAVNIGNATSTTTVNGPAVFADGIDSALPGGPKAGRFYGSRAPSVPVNTGLSAANRLWVTPVYIGANATLKSLSFDIGTGNSSAWNARMCVFADTGAGLPGTNVVDSGTVAIGSGSVTGIQTASLASGAGVALKAGTYWVGLMADSTSESLFAFNNATAYMTTVTTIGFASASNLFTNGPSAGYYMAQTLSSGCPTGFSGTPTDANGQVVPYIAMGY